MIRSIELHNFQSHADTIIKFCKGVNAICGISGSGKTAILRAFNWVFNNKPLSDSLMSYWAEEMYVTVEFYDGTKITRGRDKKGNYYKMGKEEFRAFKQEVPLPIQKALNLNEINFQSQLDPPFLLSNSPGEVAQILNRIVHLDVIDTAISNIRKRKAGVDQEYKYTEATIESLTEKLKQFDQLEDMEVDVQVYEQLSQKLIRTTSSIRELSSLISQIEKAELEVEKYSVILKAEPRLKRALSLHDDLIAAQEKISDLARFIKQIREKEDEIVYYEQQADKLQREFDKSIPSKCPLCGK